MLPVTTLISGFWLYLSAKIMDRRRLHFLLAAAIFAVGLGALRHLVVLRMPEFPEFVIQTIIIYVVAAPIYFVLDYFEDTIAIWLAAFVVGFVVFGYFL